MLIMNFSSYTRNTMSDANNTGQINAWRRVMYTRHVTLTDMCYPTPTTILDRLSGFDHDACCE
jgi:hypothetical protein